MSDTTAPSTVWPVTLDEVLAGRERIRPHLPPTPLRAYAALDARVGRGIRVCVKHENHQPTNAFKARNALSAILALPDDARRRGVVAATRGNHGAGLAWAGRLTGTAVTVCVPLGNNAEKNEAIRGFGAELIEAGSDYDASAEVAARLVEERGMTLVHSTNHAAVIAGAGTIALEMLEQEPALDALVVSVGGGSQAVGALTVARALRPGLRVYGVQAAAAPGTHDSWHAGRPQPVAPQATLADGLATRGCYDATFGALREGLAGFTTVTEGEIAAAMRTLLATTHTLVEGAGAAGFAGLMKLRDDLGGQRVGIILSGGNVDAATLRRVVNGEV
ncbi:MAG: Pyridoxal-5-phosphate-dependent protein beta subunit [Gemmatimonadetes bacterium]|nr:Pyridoxal-5-phosphate-dependent protein beta subunit [Gemmatimonadota bacterium]